MATIRNLTAGEDKKSSAPSTHAIDDGRGNVALGHFEASFVPSFTPGTRISDVQFIVDSVVSAESHPQADTALLRQLQGGV